MAIVGTSGSGKTTLVDLLLGIQNPNSGHVRISGLKPLEVVRRWPGALAYVPQDTHIINGSIKDNILLGYDPEDFKESFIYSAINTAQLQSLVQDAVKGINTHIGERGTNLSGGQKQRIGIARALLTRPKLLVLDEATSSLDSETEANLTDAVKQLRGVSTIVIIAHRLSTVREADVVIYLEKGTIKAIGNFAEVRKLVPNFDKQARLMGL